MGTVQELQQVAQQLGLQGQDALSFIKEQQELARIKRIEERDEKEAQRQHEADQRQHEADQRQHEIEIERIREGGNNNTNNQRNGSKVPKLPCFKDGQDMIDSFLQRFERYAQSNNWNREEWAISLSVLLTGKALDVYSRLSEEDAQNYDQLKKALFKRYRLTEQGYCEKFRSCKPELDESTEQFIFRLKSYLEKWIELSETAKTYNGIRDLILKEQIIDACPKDLGIYLQERAPKTLDDLASIAEQYLKAHSKQLYQNKSANIIKEKFNSGDDGRKRSIDMYCTICKTSTHQTSNCRYQYNSTKKEFQCFKCGKANHMAKDCYLTTKISRCAAAEEDTSNCNHTCNSSAAAEEDTTRNQQCSSINVIDKYDIDRCIEGDKLLLANGETINIIANACQDTDKKMPVITGKIGMNRVTVLRDSGCSGVIVKKQFVKKEQYTGKEGNMIMADKTLRRAQLAKLVVNTPYYSGEVEALCIPDAIYDLFIGNIPNAREPNNPDPNWDTNDNSTIISAVENPKQISYEEKDKNQIGKISRKKFIELQQQDEKIQEQFRKVSSGNESLIKHDDLIYRVVENKTGETVVKQLMVPSTLQEYIMESGHSNKMSGHLGIKKTQDKITAHFFWKGAHQDIQRYCKSCDICQRAVYEGKIPQAPMGKMPIKNEPFKKIGPDITENVSLNMQL